MQVKPGFKLTDVGMIPEDWDARSLLDLADRKKELFDDGDWIEAEYLTNGGIRLVQTGNIGEGQFTDKESKKYISAESFKKLGCKDLQVGDILICRLAEPAGRACLLPYIGEDRVITAVDVTIFRPPSSNADRSYLVSVFNTARWFQFVNERCGGSTRTRIARGELGKIKVPLPPLPEQRAIAEALSDVDALLGALDRLIAKKRDLKQAAMQQLLTGQTRLPGFHGEWEVKRIADIASPASEKNFGGETLPVLTCSKHLGFVDSLGFFKNQVFSKDLSTYKIIRRGQIGYPANHVEEGSVGLQDLYDVAVVSPIYVVFSVGEGVNSFFLHRLLKLDSYRQKFKTATTSSVDRRGSLRWPAFSEVTVSLPSLPEQTAIAGVLAEMDAELAGLEQRREKTRALKQAMMQELLTGRTRLVAVPAVPKKSACT